jgi:3-methyladenine DNA glycosylase/8-oxoguanine DNA glycosylase
MLTRPIEVGPTDLRATLVTQGMYPGDPTHRWYDRGFAKAVLTPDGPGTMRLTWDGGRVDASAWGDGAEWLLDRAPGWVGALDDVTGFDPGRNRRVEQLWRRHGDFRLSRGGVIWQELVLVVLGQRVATSEAVATFARLCARRGEPAPGPCDLRLPPTPEAVAAMTAGDLHRMNVERRRADALLLAARRADRLEEAATMDPAAALARLTALPGLGAWTATSVVTVSHGDPDTIVLGDYGLPTLVNYAFTGDSRRLPPETGGDEVMCAHLEPWRGHRQRVVRLLFAAGISAPRRAPRRANPDIRRL